MRGAMRQGLTGPVEPVLSLHGIRPVGDGVTHTQLTVNRSQRKRTRDSVRWTVAWIWSITLTQLIMQHYTCRAFLSPFVVRRAPGMGSPSGSFPSKLPDVLSASQSSSFNQPSRDYYDSSSQSPSSFPSSAPRSALAGLSKLHRSILSRTQSRQRFVTGKYPITVRVIHNHPTRSWLNKQQNTDLLVNNTAPLKSLASLDRFQWLDDEERVFLQKHCSMVSLELIAEIHCDRPAYLQTIPWVRRNGGSDVDGGYHRPWHWNEVATTANGAKNSPKTETLWITGFSLTGRKGILKSVCCERGIMESINSRTERMLQWPNEVISVPEALISNSTVESHRHITSKLQDALLVCDGFLVPGKDRGGLRLVMYPGDALREWTVSLTPTSQHRWFYHRAVWMDLTGDGRMSILAARCQVSVASRENGGVTSGITKNGELVWLECPKPPKIDSETGTPLDTDGTVFDPFSARHTPWKTRVLAQGPDVMFCVADLDPNDDTIEVMSSQFFDKKVSLHSIRKGPRPRVVFERVIDDQCGSAFGSILCNLDGNTREESRIHAGRVIDAGTTVGDVKAGDSFSHLLVTSHECTFAESDNRRGSTHLNDSDDGGSLFAYRVPRHPGAWKTEVWQRSVIASGFKVNGQLSNMINPGAPGLVYTFHARQQDKLKGKRPLIAVAGDCAESAYIFRPEENSQASNSRSTAIDDTSARYRLMVDIKCESTVGSIGVGYDEFTTDTPQEEGYAKLFIPCHEKDKILVFALGSGDDEPDDMW